MAPKKQSQNHGNCNCKSCTKYGAYATYNHIIASLNDNPDLDGYHSGAAELYRLVCRLALEAHRDMPKTTSQDIDRNDPLSDTRLGQCQRKFHIPLAREMTKILNQVFTRKLRRFQFDEYDCSEMISELKDAFEDDWGTKWVVLSVKREEKLQRTQKVPRRDKKPGRWGGGSHLPNAPYTDGWAGY